MGTLHNNAGTFLLPRNDLNPNF